MKYRSTVGKRTLMKMSGLGANKSKVTAAEPISHDLDEVIATPMAQWKRPWWLSSVDDPTVEIDWERMQRFDAGKTQHVSYASYVGDRKNKQLKEQRANKTKQWLLESRPE